LSRDPEEEANTKCDNKEIKNPPWDCTLFSKRSPPILNSSLPLLNTTLGQPFSCKILSIINAFADVSSPKGKGISWLIQT
jgi:hypothetical protein